MGEDASRSEPTLDAFTGDPTRRLEDWAWLWTGDHPFPIHGRPGLVGRVVRRVKRLLRPIFKSVLGDVWDRQRVFNLILLETLVNERGERRHLGARAEDFQTAIEAHAGLLEQLDRRSAEAMTEVLRHNDALFARVDQKLDRYRREAKDLWHRLGAFIAVQEAGAASLATAQREQTYVELERLHRGTADEIRARAATYLSRLERAGGPVLDLGCGRGEALKLYAEHDLAPRGVDSSTEMVALCRTQGLDAEEGDLFEYLAAVEEGTLGGIVSFHVIEHLPSELLERLVRLAWRALRPGGVLVLETPSPLSVVMSARQFWIDPTHLRPVHPEWLEITFREAGFDSVERLDLHPFADAERLPEIELDGLEGEARVLADRVNRLRDGLDDLLFGARDYGLVGTKPPVGSGP